MFKVSASLIHACLLAEQLRFGIWLQDRRWSQSTDLWQGEVARRVVVSAGISIADKLHYVDEKAKVNADYFVNNYLIPKLVEDDTALVPDGFIFQHDGAPAHAAHAT